MKMMEELYQTSLNKLKIIIKSQYMEMVHKQDLSVMFQIWYMV